MASPFTPDTIPGNTFNGGTITSGLVVDASNTPNGYAEDVLSGGLMVEDILDVWENADGTGARWRLRPGVIAFPNSPVLELKDAVGVTRLKFTDVDGLMTMDASGNVAIRIDPTGITYLGLNFVSSVLAGGAFVTGQNTVPADGDIGAGQCAIWFDKTNGVGNTKLMLKGKSADGTVKTASIVLT